IHESSVVVAVETIGGASLKSNKEIEVTVVVKVGPRICQRAGCREDVRLRRLEERRIRRDEEGSGGEGGDNDPRSFHHNTPKDTPVRPSGGEWPTTREPRHQSTGGCVRFRPDAATVRVQFEADAPDPWPDTRAPIHRAQREWVVRCASMAD